METTGVPVARRRHSTRKKRGLFIAVEGFPPQKSSESKYKGTLMYDTNIVIVGSSGAPFS